MAKEKLYKMDIDDAIEILRNNAKDGEINIKHVIEDFEHIVENIDNETSLENPESK
jgi:predicted RNA methylase